VRFGANYTPRRGWFHHWLDFDPGEQREDFETLARLDLDHVRVFCLWPLFQPQRGLIRQRALDDLARLYDVAAEAGLDVTVHAVAKNYGSLLIGPWSTVTYSDKGMAGTNHVLPTAGGAHHSAGLSVSRFVRPLTYQRVRSDATHLLADAVETISASEGMAAHQATATLRKARVGLT
jgi:endo-1,4-beta-mannosidase